MQFIRAVDRGGLNAHLLNELESMPNVQFFFHHKLIGADLDKNCAWFEVRGETSRDSSQPREKVTVDFDLVIGADGAHSMLRYQLMKFTRMSYQQSYIDTLWCEFTIAPLPQDKAGKHNGFALFPNRLHIWPGGSFMFIAIASLDKSFTCTLFLPASIFADIDNHVTDLVHFFRTNFPGVTPDLIPADALAQQYAQNPHLPLIDIRCSPYHHAASAVILGDAAHAMVPFYGQGMNAGLEDVRVLYDLLDAHAPSSLASDQEVGVARAEALAAYSALRAPDAHAINELALRNYDEMCDGVRRPLYRLRKAVEERVSVWFPACGVRTQYCRVSFGNARYSDVARAVAWQAGVLAAAMSGVGFAGVVGIVMGVRRWLGGGGWIGKMGVGIGIGIGMGGR